MTDTDGDTDAEQATIDPFRELNRYDERDEEWPSSEVFEEPRRTLANGWMKFHAARDCGARNVAYVEEINTRMHSTKKYEYNLRCWACQHNIEEDEVLFLGGDWWSQYGWRDYGRPIDDLFIPEGRVLELGPDPEQADLRRALNLCRIERQAGPHIGGPLQQQQWRACEDCDNEVPFRFDDRCRMCYDGEWTERMQSSLDAFGQKVREWHNNSFIHRLPKELTPTAPTGKVGQNEMLWRRHDAEGTTKLVEVTQRLEDQDAGHIEYVLQDPTHTYRWQYHEDDVDDCFWATGLYNRDEVKPVMDDRICEVWQRVCDHSFSEVHDPETHEVTGEQCINCRKRRDANGA